MLTLQNVVAMRSPLRLAAIATIAGLFFASPSQGQTYTTCNPTQGQCPADPALGKSVNIDFRSGASNLFTAQGNPTYDSNGASFSIAKSGDSPTLVSKWYIMFGKYSITMKAAPGRGIVSSAVLQSDDLDEIDWEWLGAEDGQVQSNYFGKGQTTSYDRGAIHSVAETQEEFHTYTVEWTENQIIWQIDGTTVRVLNAGEANGQYPQSPMQMKIGAWSGGDASNSPGTIQWAEGPTDYSAGPYSMVVQSLAVVDYSTGTSYTYGDTSGSWESIESTGGSVNGNSGGSVTVATAPAITSTSTGGSAWDGTHKSDTSTATYTTLPGLPSGWTVNPSGKVVPSSAATTTSSQSIVSTSSPAPSPAALCSGSGYSVVTSYNQQGFLTTATVNVGASTGWDDRGFPTTVYPANCQASNPPIAAGEVLQITSATSAQIITSTQSGFLAAASADTTSLITSSIPNTSGAERRRTRWMAGPCSAVLAFAFAAFMA